MPIHGVGHSGLHASGSTPNQALNDFINQLMQGEKSGTVNTTALTQDAQTINSNLGSFNPPLNPQFADDIRDFAMNGAQGTGILAQLMNASAGHAVSSTISGLALALQAEYEGSDSSLESQFSGFLTTIIGNPNSPQKYAEPLQMFATAFSALRPTNLPASFLDDCEDAAHNQQNGTGIMSQFLDATGGDVNGSTISGLALAIQAQFEGSDSSLESQFSNLLSNLLRNPTNASGYTPQLQMLATAFSALHPADLPASFLGDCQDAVRNLSNGTGIIAQLLNATSERAGPATIAGLTMALQAQFEGSDSSLEAQFSSLMTQLMANPSNLPSDAGLLQAFATAFGTLRPSDLPSQFLNDCQDFIQNGANGSGLFAQLLDSKNPTTTAELAKQLLAESEG